MTCFGESRPWLQRVGAALSVFVLALHRHRAFVGQLQSTWALVTMCGMFRLAF